MKIIGTTIFFKSEPENYFKEKHGSKPNTARILDRKDELAVQAARDKLERISITNTYSGRSFERELTDITNFNFTHEDIDIWIFSWKNYQLIND